MVSGRDKGVLFRVRRSDSLAQTESGPAHLGLEDRWLDRGHRKSPPVSPQNSQFQALAPVTSASEASRIHRALQPTKCSMKVPPEESKAFMRKLHPLASPSVRRIASAGIESFEDDTSIKVTNFMRLIFFHYGREFLRSCRIFVLASSSRKNQRSYGFHVVDLWSPPIAMDRDIDTAKKSLGLKLMELGFCSFNGEACSWVTGDIKSQAFEESPSFVIAAQRDWQLRFLRQPDRFFFDETAS
ncbi:hypothetical protein Bca52824_052158 [Brassica carinata]|uniref:Uncharacterized protein n=1 Tax=Brassica carinata TaxID=52824 RepID=A0A8X7R6Q7_BRACI|nr:hypothetical protein Bca52824_052158 [Brassica carinata]